MPDNIKNFINKWTGRGNEKQETQQFWNDIIYDILLAPKDTLIEYEKPVKINGQTKFIDAYLPSTKVLIEQKSLGINLMKAEPQSDGMKLTPYEQGRRYGGYLPYDEQPRWIIDSNFDEVVSGTGRTVTASDSLLNTTPDNMQAWCYFHYSAAQTVV